MALMQCPECGAQISDKAHACPSCGLPLQAAISGVGEEQPQPSQPAPQPAPASGIVEMIYPFESTKQAFHLSCMRQLMKRGEADVFERMDNIKISQNYIWVREFGRGEERDYYPMSAYGEEFFQDLEWMKMMRGVKFNNYFSREKIVPYHSSFLSEKRLVPREFSAAECAERYLDDLQGLGLEPTDNFYCLPVYEEVFDYDDKHYIFRGVGNSLISKFCWNDMPESALLKDGPKWVDFNLFRRSSVVVGYLLMAAFALLLVHTLGFWITLLIALIAIGLLFYAGSLLIEPFTSLLERCDKAVSRRINTRRREEFLREAEAIQQRKKLDAKNYLDLDLSYEMPKYPIP